MTDHYDLSVDQVLEEFLSDNISTFYKLDFFWKDVGIDEMEEICEAITNRKIIVDLDLSATNSKNDNTKWKILGDFLKTDTYVQSLDIGDNHITKDDLIHIVNGLRKNKTLKHIVAHYGSLPKDTTKIMTTYNLHVESITMWPQDYTDTIYPDYDINDPSTYPDARHPNLEFEKHIYFQKHMYIISEISRICNVKFYFENYKKISVHNPFLFCILLFFKN